MTEEFTLLENRLRQPFFEMGKKYGKQKFTIWAVWTYMLWRSTNGVFCLPESLVLDDLGMNKNALRRVRTILVNEGWLKREELRDTGGEFMTRVWVLTSPQHHNGVVDEPQPHLTTDAKWGYSVYGSGFGSGLLDSDSRSGASPPAETSKDEGKPKPQPEPKPTPVNPNGHGNSQGKKKTAPDGTPYPPEFDSSWSNVDRTRWLIDHGLDRGKNFHADMDDFNIGPETITLPKDWEEGLLPADSNSDEPLWTDGWTPDGHRSKQGRMVEASPQKATRSVVEEGKPTPTATPLHDPPSSAPPPKDGLTCPLCGGPKEYFDDFCSPCFNKQWPNSIENTEDNRRDLNL